MSPRPPDSQLPIPVICGPTAGGKSDLALLLAHQARAAGLASESRIITADAYQVYVGMDIGTAKPTPAERQGIVHELIDIVPLPAERPFTVEDWLTRAHTCISECREQGVLPIVVGGTHLYIKSLLEGLFKGPDPDPALRAELSAMDPAERRAELERVDSKAAARIHPNDVRRTIRALEVFRQTGTPISQLQSQWDQPSGTPSPFQLVILDWEVEPLNRRINARVKSMMERGLLEEVRELCRTGKLPPGSQPAEALGYKQLLSFLTSGSASPERLEDTVERIKVETRRFAKNQRTWLRRLRTIPHALPLPMPGTSPETGVGALLTRLAQGKLPLPPT